MGRRLFQRARLPSGFPYRAQRFTIAQPISETPNAMTVIDRKMIDASGARNIPELFRLVPGMYVGYADGHTAIVSYRGTTDTFARRMQVLIDGRTVYLPRTGRCTGRNYRWISAI